MAPENFLPVFKSLWTLLQTTSLQYFSFLLSYRGCGVASPIKSAWKRARTPKIIKILSSQFRKHVLKKCVTTTSNSFFDLYPGIHHYNSIGYQYQCPKRVFRNADDISQHRNRVLLFIRHKWFDWANSAYRTRTDVL